ncbi:MAG: hypothetical protein R2750_11115 [Bacteroidales bacterium]
MNQKEEEKLVMSLFRKKFEDFPKGKLVASESPDFTLKVGRHNTLGIELSRLVDEQMALPERIKTSLSKKIEKLELYQKKVFNQIWLILYVDEYSGILPAKTMEIEMDQTQKFNRQFLFDLFSMKIVEIRIL